MNPPQLNRRMVLEAQTHQSDGSGGFASIWEPLGQIWVALKPGSGRETDLASATISRVPFKITTRAAPVGSLARPKAGQRMKEGARQFQITAVADHPDYPQYLICSAIEEVAP